MKKLALQAIVALLVIGFPCRSARALTLDTFGGDLQVNSGGVLAISSDTIADASAVGGHRALRIVKTTGAADAQISTRFNTLTLSQSPFVTAQATITWDGTVNKDTVTFGGLGGIDLLQDEANGILLNVTWADHPVEFVITIFDAGDPLGETWSRARTTVPPSEAPQKIFVPFVAFTEHGGLNQPASLQHVGALQLLINGSSSGSRVVLSSIMTDGKCTQLPRAGQKVLIDLSDKLNTLLAQLNAQYQNTLGTIVTIQKVNAGWARLARRRATTRYNQMLDAIHAFQPSILQCRGQNACQTAQQNQSLIATYKLTTQKLLELSLSIINSYVPAGTTRTKKTRAARSYLYAQMRVVKSLPTVQTVCH